MLKFILLAVITILVVTGCKAFGAEGSGFKSISQKQAMELMQTEKNYIILDVRTPGEYAEGHIPKAVLLPNETIGSQPPVELPNKEQLIMVYCRSGNRSKQAAQKLAKLGYTNIVEFGGINTWTGPIVKEK